MVTNISLSEKQHRDSIMIMIEETIDNDDINHNKTFHRKGTATSSFHKAKKVI